MTSKTEIELNLLRCARRDIETDVKCYICWSLSSMATIPTMDIVWGLQREILEFLDGKTAVRFWLDEDCSSELIKIFQLAIINTLMSRRQQ